MSTMKAIKERITTTETRRMILQKALTERIIGAAIEVRKHIINFNVPFLDNSLLEISEASHRSVE